MTPIRVELSFMLKLAATWVTQLFTIAKFFSPTESDPSRTKIRSRVVDRGHSIENRCLELNNKGKTANHKISKFD